MTSRWANMNEYPLSRNRWVKSNNTVSISCTGQGLSNILPYLCPYFDTIYNQCLHFEVDACKTERRYGKQILKYWIHGGGLYVFIGNLWVQHCEYSLRREHLPPNKCPKSIPACLPQTKVHQYLLQLCNIIGIINTKRITSSLYNQPLRGRG